jgi:hypothetical protein
LVPEVDDVRPAACRSCRHPAKTIGKVWVYGHGRRLRQVIVFPAFVDGPALVEECWSRRYRCVRCGAVHVVLPPGVMPRFLYSVAAIIVAWLLVEPRPTGQGLTHEQAYARQGMYRQTSWREASKYRWRSIDRWAGLAGQWWPSLAMTDGTGLLVHFVSRSGGGGLEAVVRAGVIAHVQWGRDM